MAIVVTLDEMLARRKVKSRDLAAHVGITEANLSLLKSGKVKGVRFETLSAICSYLQCQPADLLAWVPDADTKDSEAPASPIPWQVHRCARAKFAEHHRSCSGSPEPIHAATAPHLLPRPVAGRSRACLALP